MELADNPFILHDTLGNELRFIFLDLVKLDNTEYIILLPEDYDTSSPEVVILEIEGDDANNPDNEVYSVVTDASTLQRVFSIFQSDYR